MVAMSRREYLTRLFRRYFAWIIFAAMFVSCGWWSIPWAILAGTWHDVIMVIFACGVWSGLAWFLVYPLTPPPSLDVQDGDFTDYAGRTEAKNYPDLVDWDPQNYEK